MTLKIQPKTQTQTRTPRYRPVERTDGVIVLQRPYQPPALVKLGAKQPEATKFEKHIPIFSHPISSRKSRREPVLSKHSDLNLSHVGALFCDQGRDGYNAPVNAGRGGYNDALKEKGLDEFSRYGSDFRNLNPMSRFLQEDGPWTTQSQL